MTETGHGSQTEETASFALNLFCGLMLFSPHEVWTTLKFVVYSKAVVEYSHSGATCSATSNRHDRALLLDKWQAAKSAAERQVCAVINLVRSRPSPDVPRRTSPEFPGTGKGAVANSESAYMKRKVLPPQGRSFRKIWSTLA